MQMSAAVTLQKVLHAVVAEISTKKSQKLSSWAQMHSNSYGTKQSLLVAVPRLPARKPDAFWCARLPSYDSSCSMSSPKASLCASQQCIAFNTALHLLSVRTRMVEARQKHPGIIYAACAFYQMHLRSAAVALSFRCCRAFASQHHAVSLAHASGFCARQDHACAGQLLLLLACLLAATACLRA